MIILFGSLLLIAGVIMVLILLNGIVKKMCVTYTNNNRTLADLFAELDSLIEVEFDFSVTIPYTNKDFKMVTDIHETTAYVAARVMDALLPQMFDSFEEKGIKREYMTTYTIRRITFLLINYMDSEHAKRKGIR